MKPRLTTKGLKMSGKFELEWFFTSEKPHPDKPGMSRYEHVLCLVNRKNYGMNVLAWNCEHLCWDGADMDDYECGVSDVLAWMALPDCIPPLENHS
jgi:hypothetical protein